MPRPRDAQCSDRVAPPRSANIDIPNAQGDHHPKAREENGQQFRLPMHKQGAVGNQVEFAYFQGV